MTHKIKSLDDVLEHELKDIFSAENQLLKALPRLSKGASSESLREAFQQHLAETQTQIERLQKISSILGIKLTGYTCEGMKGLVEECLSVLNEEVENDALCDTMIIAAAQRIEHYEIAAYGTSKALAEDLGHDEVVTLLDQSLNEEKKSDRTLTQICEDEVLIEAGAAPEEPEAEEEGEYVDEDEPPVRKSRPTPNEKRPR